jgi:hypothetical protein
MVRRPPLGRFRRRGLDGDANPPLGGWSLSVPYSSAQRDHGIGRGPTVLLEEHGLAERLSSDGFDVTVDTVEIPDGLVPEIARTFELNRRLAVSDDNLSGSST